MSKSYKLGIVALLVVVVVVAVAAYVLRPDGDDPSEPASGAGTSSAPTGPPAVATDEDFCSGFRSLAESQSTYVSGGESEAGQLRDAADALVAGGVPASMSRPARAGYYTLIDGVYDSIGETLDPAAVGAPAAPVEDSDAAFSTYLDEFCPA